MNGKGYTLIHTIRSTIYLILPLLYYRYFHAAILYTPVFIFDSHWFHCPPFPSANIYHHFKIHLHIHQSFGDHSCLLEMDVVCKEQAALSLHDWTLKLEFPLRQIECIGAKLNCAILCTVEKYMLEKHIVERTICCAMNQQIVHFAEVLRSACHCRILLKREVDFL